MTTAQIETQGDAEGLATADINVQFLLRHKITHEFFFDCGYPSWARKTLTQTLAAGLNYIDVPSRTVRHIRHVCISPDWGVGLSYIGDDDYKVLAAKANTTAGKPTAFYRDFDGTEFRRVSFNAPADTAYTIGVIYHLTIPFPDDTTSIQLDGYIPNDCQWGLVLGIQREVARRRFGANDPRFPQYDQEYQTFTARISENKEKSSGSRIAYIG
jgi:hypothetical protein